MFDAPSSPSNEKPTPNSSELFPDLGSKRSPKPSVPAASQRFAPPAPPVKKEDAILLDAEPDEDHAETNDLRQMSSDDDATTLDATEVEEVDDDEWEDVEASASSDLDALSVGLKKKPALAKSPIVPKCDADLDDEPTVARPSPLSGPVSSVPPPSRAPHSRVPAPPQSRIPTGPISRVPAPPSSRMVSGKLPPPPSLPPSRHSVPVASTPSASAPLPSAPVASVRAAGAAAALTATGAAPAISVPPPSYQPVASRPAPISAEASSSGQLSTIPPVAESVRVVPPQRAKPSRLPWLFAAAALFVAFVGGGGALAYANKAALGFGGGAGGTLVVTAAGPGGKAVDGVRILADGTVVCESSPCRMDSLKAGTHFITAEADGYQSTAARAISVAAGEESALHIDLSPKAGAEPEAKAEPKSADEPAEAEKVDLSADEPQEEAKATAQAPAAKPATGAKPGAKVAAKPAAPADKKADEDKGAPAAMGTLNINSIPRSTVVLDGRPLGMTPQMGISVPAGPHSVVFVHPELGRKVGGATVKAGGTATVAVRFE
jgi:hypothetical protein